jgi:integrase/recombinase XerD
MKQSEWMRFFQALEKINRRDCLISKLVLQGGKRSSEVLSLHSEKIFFEENKIIFIQSKTKGLYKESVIFYPGTVMEELKEYLGDRTGGVFVTRTGRKVAYRNVYNTFVKAGTRANIPFRVTSHVLRTSAITFLKQQGYADSEIMKISGHASSEMVHAYDKSSQEENPTKHLFLVK